MAWARRSDREPVAGDLVADGLSSSDSRSDVEALILEVEVATYS
jgi:hypothetical protein